MNEVSDEMRICVVTPTLNMAQYLEETIGSVIANLAPSDEYYIIDGGSTDGTQEIISRYQRYLTGWVSEPDNGYADALYKGFGRTTAPLMCWINAGDLILPGAFDLVRRQFKCDGNELLFGDDYYIDEAGDILQQSRGDVHNLRNMMLYGGWTPLQDACFWRRSLYERCGGIDPGQKFAADYGLFLRMSLVGRCRYFPAVLTAFRRHAAQKSIAGSSHYDGERKVIRCQEIRKHGEHALERDFKRMFFWVAVRLRARLSPLNRRHTPCIGVNVKDVKAELIE